MGIKFWGELPEAAWQGMHPRDPSTSRLRFVMRDIFYWRFGRDDTELGDGRDLMQPVGDCFFIAFGTGFRGAPAGMTQVGWTVVMDTFLKSDTFAPQECAQPATRSACRGPRVPVPHMFCVSQTRGDCAGQQLE